MKKKRQKKAKKRCGGDNRKNTSQNYVREKSRHIPALVCLRAGMCLLIYFKGKSKSVSFDMSRV